jgi:hypothetical protein
MPCILFDEDGNVTRDRGELRSRQEFDKARTALVEGSDVSQRFTLERSPTMWVTSLASITS